jgi:hypothetical protein
MSLDPDDNPLLALIASTPATTVLDKRGRPSSVPSGSDEEAPIRLQFRQPSFSSLQEGIGKDGEPIQNVTLDGDPVVVFSSEQNAEADGPIVLKVRQASCSSLVEGNLVWKGNAPPPSLDPVVEEEPRPADDPDLTLSEETTTPQTQLMLQLFKGNQGRWKQMGFEPPNFQALVRTASQSDFGAPADEPPPQTAAPARPPPGTLNVVPEAIEEAIEDAPETIEEVAEEAPEAIEAVAEGAPETDEEEEGSDEIPSTTHLSEIDPAITGPPLRAYLLSGDVNDVPQGSIRTVRRRLREVQQICADELWVEEAAYVNGLIAALDGSKKGQPPVGPRREHVDRDAAGLAAERACLVAQHEQAVSEQHTKLKEAIAELDAEFQKAAANLDERYASPDTLKRFAHPSKQLLEARVIAQRLLRQDRVQEAARCTKQISQMAQQEQKQAAQRIQRQYEADDRKLKEQFAVRRQVILAKFGQAIEDIENRFEAKIAVADKRSVEVKERAATNMADSRSQAASARRIGGETKAAAQPSGVTTSWKLDLSPPKKIRRYQDLQTLGTMTLRLFDGTSPRRQRC